MKKIFTIIILAAACFFKPNVATAQVNVQDSLALVDLYNSTRGIHWDNHANWLTGAPVSTWYGVLVTGNRVRFLQLPINHMNGTIPSSLGDLTGLTRLSLAANELSGSIPSSLGNLTNLDHLDLSQTKLSGSIPSSFGNLINLESLMLQYDKLGGNIPSSFGKLVKLRYLTLAHNRLSGSIPSLAKLDSLGYLDLSFNQLSGNIFSSLGKLNGLTYLDLSFNQLSGSISSVSNLPSIVSLFLSFNQLSGNISSLSNLSTLEFLFVKDNQLSGSIPSSFSNLINLIQLDISDNQLSGELPSLNNLVNLGDLNASNNQLSGSIPASMHNLTNLSYLNLSWNQLSDTIPSLTRLKFIYELNLEYNKFTFESLEKVANTFFSLAHYSPQAIIHLNLADNKLSVSAGGTLANNTYKWYKNGNLFKTIIGDSTLSINKSGAYYADVTNSVATALTLHSDTVNYTAGTNVIAAQNNIINSEVSSISLYPNPAKTTATLSFNATGKYTITITGTYGKILQTITGIAVKGENIIRFDVNKFPQGIYLVTLSDEKNKVQTVKLNKE